MIIGLLILGFLILFLAGGRILLNIHFLNEVKYLFSQSKPLRQTTYTLHQLNGLPEPVQRYFKRVLQEGQVYISYARMIHDGQFKTGAHNPWINIKGEQYATIQNPGFIWKGTTSFFTARDMFMGGQGRLVVSLLSIFNIVDGKGKTFDQGEILRWLGESVLYPTNLLPSENMHWTAIDFLTAKFSYQYLDLSLSFKVSFNESGEIMQMETKRYMDKDHLETWVIKVENYQLLNAIWVPTHFEVLWRLKTWDLSYAKFYMKRIEYDIPESFTAA